MALQRGLQKASKMLAAEVKAVAKPVDSDEDILNIATIATGSESMGRTIASCFKRVGSNGATMVEDGQTLMDEIDFTEGMEIDRGFVSPYFVKNQEAQTCEMDAPRILVTDKKIGNMNELVPVLEGLVTSKEPLLIIADDVTGEGASTRRPLSRFHPHALVPSRPLRLVARGGSPWGQGGTPHALLHLAGPIAHSPTRPSPSPRGPLLRSPLFARAQQDARRARRVRNQVAWFRRSAARLPRGY